LPSKIKMLVPELSAERMKEVEAAITECRNQAADAGLATLAMDDAEVDERVTAT
jgi:hypothetical protein